MQHRSRIYLGNLEVLKGQIKLEMDEKYYIAAEKKTVGKIKDKVEDFVLKHTKSLTIASSMPSAIFGVATVANVVGRVLSAVGQVDPLLSGDKVEMLNEFAVNFPKYISGNAANFAAFLLLPVGVVTLRGLASLDKKNNYSIKGELIDLPTVAQFIFDLENKDDEPISECREFLRKVSLRDNTDSFNLMLIAKLINYRKDALVGKEEGKEELVNFLKEVNSDKINKYKEFKPSESFANNTYIETFIGRLEEGRSL